MAEERDAREERRTELRAEIEHLQGRIARSKDPATVEQLASRIRILQGRLARA